MVERTQKPKLGRSQAIELWSQPRELTADLAHLFPVLCLVTTGWWLELATVEVFTRIGSQVLVAHTCNPSYLGG
jgi:hypothetical protein